MPTPLTPLQAVDGWISIQKACDGWRVQTEGLDVFLADRLVIEPGSYEARGRATTTQPGGGVQFGDELWVFALDSGELRAVETRSATWTS